MMPPKSPPMAFEPTPAIYNPKTFYPVVKTNYDCGITTEDSPDLPMLEKVSSASEMPKRSTASAAPTAPRLSDPDIRAYTDEWHGYLDDLRDTFDHERATFKKERRLWYTERRSLIARIVELEALLKKSSPVQERFGSLSSISSSSLGNPRGSSFQSGFGLDGGFTPAIAPLPRFTEPTRVFPDDKKELRFPPTIPEERLLAPHLESLSPTAPAISSSVPVPGGMVDKRLDGIILKSTALHPEVVDKLPPQIIESILESSNASSPSPTVQPREKPIPTRLDVSRANESNLTMHAGHTPIATKMGVSLSDLASEDSKTPDANPPIPEQSHLHPVRRPREISDSYFPAVDVIDEDKALEGPLGLINKTDEDSEFLKNLDRKLLEEVQKSEEAIVEDVKKLHGAENLSPFSDSTGIDEEPEPKLKMRRSLNFGSQFGVLK
ncbi:MAG: hypothetical protein M1834_004311 [Cirrosporium novae-zelandiae]|nr:MAG: hypothetical protein M1834_004311 [Cirrosporium novae-zelandiae]